MSSNPASDDGGDGSLGRQLVARAGRRVSRSVAGLRAGTGALLGTVPALAIATGGGRRGVPPGAVAGRDATAGTDPAAATERVHRNLRADVRGAVPTGDGGLTLWGTTAASDSGPTLWLSRLSDGEAATRRPLAGDGFDVARALTRSHDGGVVLAGNRSPAAEAAASAVVAVAVDGTGRVRGRHVVDRPAFACCSALCRSADGGYLLAGGSMGADEAHARPWILKLDGELEPVWRANGPPTSGDCPRIVRDRGDDVAVIGGRSDPRAPLRFRTLHRDGTSIAARSIEGTAGAHVRAVAETEAGGFVLAGHRIEASETARLWIGALDADGRLRWDRTYRRGGDSIGHDVVETADGLAVAGERTGADGRRRATVVTIDRTGTWQHEWTFDRGASARSVWVTGADGAGATADAAAVDDGSSSRRIAAEGGPERLRVAGIAVDRGRRHSIPWDGRIPTARC